jgi:single-stranded-DNA-specific exonuclease
VIGILAGRIKERFHRPVIALAAADGGLLRGSARSIPGLHIRDLLATLDSRRPGLIERFGGHAMAAGITLAAARLAEFSLAFAEEVDRQLGGPPDAGVIATDGELAPSELDLATARLLRFAGPWGQGFPEPVFEGSFRVVARRLVGDAHLRLVLATGQATRIEAVAFRWGERALPDAGVRLAYRLECDAYQGLERPQLVVEALLEG